MKEAFWVGLGGFLGANARYWIGGWLERSSAGLLPGATLAINVSGSFLLGLLLGVLEVGSFHGAARLFLGVGFLGAYTTFSTFSHESVRLIETGHVLFALGYALLSVGASVVACVVGLGLGRSLG